jgi:tetratricopeptide (TPR) repeat protein
MASARHDGDEETALSYAVVGALREAEFGNRHLAREQVGAALAHAPGQQVLFLGALALARAGERGQALALARDLTQRFPNDTLLNKYWVPSIRAAVELDRGEAYQAIKYLEQTRRYELAAPQLPTNVLLYPIYLRGTAYLRAGRPQEAQAEFQKILNHPGLAGNYLLGALAHLAVGRVYDMEAAIPVVSVSRKQAADQHPGRTLEQHEAMARAHSAYQDFFGLWKDADSNISILKQAKAEHAKLH